MNPTQKAVAFFIAKNWTPEQASGVVANLVAESGLRPDAVGDGGEAYGTAQWHGDRQAKFAEVMGEPMRGSSLESQLAFVHWELQNTEKRAGEALATCTTPADAGACVSKLYERPADREGEASKRAALAQRIFDAFGGQQSPQVSETPQVSEAPQVQPQPKGAKMGAILVPLLMSVVGKFLNPTVAQNVTSIVTKDGGQSTAAQNLLQMLLGAVASSAGVTPAAMKADDSVAIQAVAAVQSNAEKLRAVEDAAAAHLNAVLPFVQQLAVLDQMRYDAENKGKQVVSTIAIAEHAAGLWDMTRTVVLIAGCTMMAISLGLLAAILYQSVSKGAIDPGLLGMTGPILMATLAAWAAIIAYRFDGSKESHAAAEAQRATEKYREDTEKA